MDEFVSKKLLVAKFNELASKYIDGDKRQRGLAYTTAADMIALADAADVQPIRHGRWIDCTFYDPCEKSWEQNYEFKCSNCEHKIYNKPNDDNLFCGHCSARMDGGADDDRI